MFPAVHKYFVFGSSNCSVTFITTYVLLDMQTYFLFLIYAINFWNYTHLCIYTQYSCLLSVKWQSQMFSLGSHICSFTSMITYVSSVCKTYSQELYSVCMHAYMYMFVCACMYVCKDTNMPVCVHPCMQIYTDDGWYTGYSMYVCASIQIHRNMHIYI